jgi:hypothetical protein
MSWTYASSNAGSSDLSWVRMRVGDCTSGDQLLQDEEIEANLSEMGDKYFAAARSARSISAWFSRRVQKSIGKLSISCQQASESYERLAVQLEMEGGFRATPYCGGISVSDKENVESDSDRVLPQFYLGQTDIPGSGVYGSTDSDLVGL